MRGGASDCEARGARGPHCGCAARRCEALQGAARPPWRSSSELFSSLPSLSIPTFALPTSRAGRRPVGLCGHTEGRPRSPVQVNHLSVAPGAGRGRGCGLAPGPTPAHAGPRAGSVAEGRTRGRSGSAPHRHTIPPVPLFPSRTVGGMGCEDGETGRVRKETCAARAKIGSAVARIDLGGWLRPRCAGVCWGGAGRAREGIPPSAGSNEDCSSPDGPDHVPPRAGSSGVF